MSSALGHAATGMAAYLACRPQTGKRHWSWFVLVALAPDFDYLPWWAFRYAPDRRVTHSLAYCLAVATLAWRLGRPDTVAPGRHWPALAIASCSHLVLDLLVGVHSLPLFWPFPANQVSSPLGLLPSAAHVSVANYYFWRNLLIETGVLWPLLWLSVVLVRRPLSAELVPRLYLLTPAWLIFLVWSIDLHR